MKNTLVYALLFTCSMLTAQSMEVGATFGGMTYSGDINEGSKLWQLNKIHSTVGGTFGYNFSDLLALRLNLSHGTISGNDAFADSERRKARNLHFESRLIELSAVGEVNFLRFNPAEGRNFTIYGLGGVGIFHFNPKALYEGAWLDLQPLGTEGQFLGDNPNPYRLWEISFPIGAGIKYALNENWIIGLELRGHLTMSDYLDDVSTVYPNQGVLAEEMGRLSASLSDRKAELPGHKDPNPSDGRVRGNPDYNDYFFTGAFTLSYRLIDSKTSRKKMRQSRNQCPSF